MNVAISNWSHIQCKKVRSFHETLLYNKKQVWEAVMSWTLSPQKWYV